MFVRILPHSQVVLQIMKVSQTSCEILLQHPGCFDNSLQSETCQKRKKADIDVYLDADRSPAARSAEEGKGPHTSWTPVTS